MTIEDFNRTKSTTSVDIPIYKPDHIKKLYLIFLALGFSVYSIISEGFYMDDEIGHFVTAKDAISDLWLIFTYWSRPFVKIWYVIPSQFGIIGSHILTIIISLITVNFTYKVAKQLGIEQKASTMLFLGLQPLYFQLSFRFYTEIWGALAIIMIIYYWNKKSYNILAFIASYAFAIRQELGLIAIILSIYFVLNRKWRSILILMWSPILINILGWMKTGDMYFLVSSYVPTSVNIETSWKMGFWVYFKNFFGIYGIIISLLAFVSLTQWKKHKEIIIMFFIMFIFYSILAEPSFMLSRGQGSTRHILVLSPIVAVLAGIGFDIIKNKLNLILAVNLPLIIITFLVINLVIQEPPKTLSPEAAAVKEICKNLDTEENIYSNHVLVSYYLNKNTKRIREPLGKGYIFYDTHYGYRPSWGCFLKPNNIKNIKWISQTISGDRKFIIILGHKYQ